MKNVKFWKLSPAPVQRFKAGFLLEGNFTAENVEAVLGSISRAVANFRHDNASGNRIEAEKKPRETK